MNIWKTIFGWLIGQFMLWDNEPASGSNGGGGAAVADPGDSVGAGGNPDGDSGGDGGNQPSGGSGDGTPSGGSLFQSAGGRQEPVSGDQGGQGTPEPAKGIESSLARVYSGNDGSIDPEALNDLPENLQDLKPLFQKYKTEKDFIQGVKNLQFLAGRKGLAEIPDDAPESVKEEQAALLRKINRVPETPGDYEVSRPEALPESIEFKTDDLKPFLEVLHKHNANPALVQELVNIDAQRTAEALTNAQGQSEQAFAKEQQALKEAFGADMEARMGKAERMARTLGMDLNDPIFQNHKVVVALAKAGEMVSEDRLVSGDGDPGYGHDDRAKALDIVNNKSNPLYDAYHNAEHPRHEEAVKMKSDLNKRWLERKNKG